MTDELINRKLISYDILCRIWEIEMDELIDRVEYPEVIRDGKKLRYEIRIEGYMSKYFVAVWIRTNLGISIIPKHCRIDREEALELYQKEKEALESFLRTLTP